MNSDWRVPLWWLAVALVACAFRMPMLDLRPMHADEAILAHKLGTLLANGRLEYDPRDYHGPVLGYVTAPVALARGQRTLAALDEVTLRLVPAIAGVALCFTPLLFVQSSGAVAAGVAGMGLAVSTPLVFYSRYYIPEMLLALCTSVFIAMLWRGWWVAAGIAAGLALATKETAILALAAGLIAFVAARGLRRWAGLVGVVGWAVLTAVMLIGPVNAVRAVGIYLQRGTDASGWHVHPWWWYLVLLAGAGWEPLAFLGVFAWRRTEFARYATVYTCVLAAFYSFIPYKTPWCVLSIVWGLALLGGLAATEFGARARVVAALALAASAGFAADAAFRRPVDSRWAYAQTGYGVFTIRDAVERLAAASDDGRGLRIAVYSRENLWPLPWYLRDYPRITWSREVPLPGPPAPLVLVTPEQVDALRKKIYEGPPAGERELYVPVFDDAAALRPGVKVEGFAAKSLWDASGGH